MSLDLSSEFAGGHHVFMHGHAHPSMEITEHGHVLDKAGKKIGSIGHDGTLRDRAGHRIGHIGEDGKVYNRWNSGYQMRTEGEHIYDHENKKIGRGSGGSLAGAAMLLMLNKESR